MAVANGIHPRAVDKPYEGFRVLVVEDNERTLDLIVRGLRLLGVDVVGPGQDFAQGLELARHASFDLAFLDVDLDGGRTSFDIAVELRARRIPFVFMTNVMRADLGPFEGHDCYDKLVRTLDIRQVLDRQLGT